MQKEINSKQLEIDKFQYNTQTTHAEIYSNISLDIQEELNQYYERSLNLNRQEDMLGFEKTDFSVLKTMKEDFVKYVQL